MILLYLFHLLFPFLVSLLEYFLSFLDITTSYFHNCSFFIDNTTLELKNYTIYLFDFLSGRHSMDNNLTVNFLSRDSSLFLEHFPELADETVNLSRVYSFFSRVVVISFCILRDTSVLVLLVPCSLVPWVELTKTFVML